MENFNTKLAVAIILFWICIDSISLSFISNLNFQNWVKTLITPSTVVSISALIYLLFKKLLWKVKLFSFLFDLLLGLEYIPDISGEYEVEIKSNWDESIPLNGNIKVSQNYKDIFVKGKFANSKFETSNAYLFLNENKNSSKPKSWNLIYSFESEPNKTSIGENSTGFVSHKGIVELNICVDNLDCFNGFYGTDENRKTRGTISLKKILLLK